MRCGNDPRVTLTDEDRRIVHDFERYLEIKYRIDEGTAADHERAWAREYIARVAGKAQELRTRPEDQPASDT